MFACELPKIKKTDYLLDRDYLFQPSIILPFLPTNKKIISLWNNVSN